MFSFVKKKNELQISKVLILSKSIHSILEPMSINKTIEIKYQMILNNINSFNSKLSFYNFIL